MNDKSMMVTEQITAQIQTIRGQRVMLDSDLAEIYGVQTRILNQAVKRHPERFPPDFMFLLDNQEVALLKSQNEILKTSRGQHISIFRVSSSSTKHQWLYGFLIPAADYMVANHDVNHKLLYEKTSRRDRATFIL